MNVDNTKKNKKRPSLSDSQIPKIALDDNSSTKLKDNKDKLSRPSVKDSKIEICESDVEHVVKQQNYISNTNISDNKEGQGTKNTETIDVESKEKSVGLIDNKSKGNKKKIPILKILLILLVAFIVIIICVFFWNRWFRYNDKEDIIGTWNVYNSQANIIIDGSTINLAANTTLKYEVDSFAKTISFKTGQMGGNCHYRFSEDRSSIAIIESQDYNAFSSLFSDIGWAWDSFTCSMSGASLSPAYNITNAAEVDLSNTGINDIAENGSGKSVLLVKKL